MLRQNALLILHNRNSPSIPSFMKRTRGQATQSSSSNEAPSKRAARPKMTVLAAHFESLISGRDQKLLANWAADCAERVLPIFEAHKPNDSRPRHAIDSARAWARGEIRVGEARKISLAAHAAARACTEIPAKEAARAAGHAVATAHVWNHAKGPALYALKAVQEDQWDAEKAWQEARLKELTTQRTT